MDSQEIIAEIRKKQPVCGECGKMINYSQLANKKAIRYRLHDDLDKRDRFICRACLAAK